MIFVRRVSHLSVFLLLAGIGSPFAKCQNAPATDQQQKLGDIENRLANVTAELNQTRADLDSARAEIREMHQLLEEVRSHLVPAPENSAAQPQPSPMETTASSADARVQDLENRADLSNAEQAQINQIKVESASKYRVKLSGMVLFNAFSNRGNSNDAHLPEWASPIQPGRLRNNIGATMRQTLLGLTGTGPTLLGAQTSGEIHMDFFGGFPASLYGESAGLVRLRTGNVRMDWDRTTVVAGQDAPFISPLSPSSLASVGDPPLSYAGNLWTWSPELWVEHRFHDQSHAGFAFQAGIMDPLGYAPQQNQASPTPSAGEQSFQPAFASRISWQNATSELPAAIGVGGYFGNQQYTNATATEVHGWAMTADWRFPITRRFEITGEAYRGDAVGALGGGLLNNIVYNGISINTSTKIVGVNSAGGWTQVKWHTTPKLEWNLGAGQDNPFISDLRRFAPPFEYPLAWNRVSFGNFIYHAKSNLLFSAEYRHIVTRRSSGLPYSADHVNLSAGYLF